MNWALIGVAALALAGICTGETAQALPAGPPRDSLAAAQAAPLLPAGYYHRTRSRSRDAADPAPVSAPAAADSGGVKSGQWEFTTRLEAPAAAQAIQSQSGGDASYLSCIQSERAVPVVLSPQCNLDSRERQGPRVTWSMTCTNSQGAVRSDGVAQYQGDAMDATMINHFPAANGTVTDLTQRITGRYLGPCPQVEAGPVIPPGPNPSPTTPANTASGSSAQWVDPPAVSGSTAPSAATAALPQGAASAAPAEPLPPPRTRHARQRHAPYHRYYGGGVAPGGGGFFGIRIPFLGGF